ARQTRQRWDGSAWRSRRIGGRTRDKVLQYEDRPDREEDSAPRPAMRCKVCKTDNPDTAERCGTCGMGFSKRARKRSLPDEIESPFARTVEGPNRRAIRAYRVAVLSLIPFAGAVLGPLALGMSLRAWLKSRKNPEFSARGMLAAGSVLATLTTATNWAGIALMAIGLRGE